MRHHGSGAVHRPVRGGGGGERREDNSRSAAYTT